MKRNSHPDISQQNYRGGESTQKGRKLITFQGAIVRSTADFSMGTMESRKQYNENNCQPSSLYLGFKTGRELKYMTTVAFKLGRLIYSPYIFSENIKVPINI